jgi:hypothetical protein
MPGTLFLRYLTRFVMIGNNVPMSEVKRITKSAETLKPTRSIGRVSLQCSPGVLGVDMAFKLSRSSTSEEDD